MYTGWVTGQVGHRDRESSHHMHIAEPRTNRLDIYAIATGM